MLLFNLQEKQLGLRHDAFRPSISGMHATQIPVNNKVFETRRIRHEDGEIAVLKHSRGPYGVRNAIFCNSHFRYDI